MFIFRRPWETDQCGVAAVGCDDLLVVALELSHSKGDGRLPHRSQSAYNGLSVEFARFELLLLSRLTIDRWRPVHANGVTGRVELHGYELNSTDILNRTCNDKAEPLVHRHRMF
jgi:hypothetical protein